MSRSRWGNAGTVCAGYRAVPGRLHLSRAGAEPGCWRQWPLAWEPGSAGASVLLTEKPYFTRAKG